LALRDSTCRWDPQAGISNAIGLAVPSRLRESREVKAEQKGAALPAFGSRIEEEPDRQQVPSRDEKIELLMDSKVS
ncbi:MAG: hypothetical protein ACK57Y_06250, partial [Pirellulaceae bacterium]